MVLAHNTGFVEVWYGTAEGGKLEITTDAVARTETAKEYVAGKRLYGNVEGDLLYAYDMAAMGQALQPHLWARLKRVRESVPTGRRPSVRGATGSRPSAS